MKDSKIEWTDHTFNPWSGCTKVSPGCAHCYAESLAKRAPKTLGGWGAGVPRRRTSEEYWGGPIKWNRDAPLFLQCESGCRFQSTEAGLEGFCPNCGDPSADRVRPRVFCASLADVFDDEVELGWLCDLMVLIHRCQNLDWLLLTKRPQNWEVRLAYVPAWLAAAGHFDAAHWVESWLDGVAPANVWIGTTVEDQTRADQRIPHLLKIPARVRFLSCEPLLGPVDLAKAGAIWSDMNDQPIDARHLTQYVHWVICGGESGPGARPMHIDWARSLRDQCEAAGVAFFFKQWGEWFPINQDGGLIESLYVSNRKAVGDENQSALDESYGRRCTVPLRVLHKNGEDYDVLDQQAFSGMGVMSIYRVGKKAAGRLLDGIEHNAFPEVRNSGA